MFPVIHLYNVSMKTSPTVAIWWIRRDLRLADNQALQQALSSAEQVLPLFILDPVLLKSERTSTRRVDFMLAGLRALDADLQRKGSRLILRHGEPLKVLTELKQEMDFQAIFAEEDFSAYARQRDDSVAALFDLHLCGGLTVLPPSLTVKADGSPYTIFTPYSKTWRENYQQPQLLPEPGKIASPTEVFSEALPEPPIDLNTPFAMAGAPEAQRRLERFFAARIQNYASDRDRMDLEGTSSLSPYLRFGMLSARQMVNAAISGISEAGSQQNAHGAKVWLNELIWREFFYSVLFHFPQVQKDSFRPELRNIHWLNREEDFSAWKEGRTGYPIVDAAMRQLRSTGWMHNRARMIVASFLTKDLLIDWRWGEKYFMQQLLDGDVAANNGGWQWSAGTGTDAAPYFRIFNPVLQGQKFDPNGEYIRRWVPELRLLPVPLVHQPWTSPAELARMGVSYFDPIVDHALARGRCLLAYKGE